MKNEFLTGQNYLPALGRTSELRKRTDQILVATQNTPTLTTPKSRNSFITSLSPHISYLVKDSSSYVEVTSSKARLVLDADINLRKLGLELSNSQDFSENDFYLVLNKDQPPPIFISAAESLNHLNLTFLPNYTYWNHIQELSFFASAFMADNRLPFINHNDEQLHQTLKYQQYTPNHFPILLEGISANITFRSFPKKDFQLSDLTMSTSSLPHRGDNLASRFHQSNQNIVYVTDYEFPNNDTNESNHFIELIIKANVIINNAQYLYLENVAQEGWDLFQFLQHSLFTPKGQGEFFLLFHHNLEQRPKTSDSLKKIQPYHHIISDHRPVRIELAIKSLTLEV
ncbi:MAG: hypothetical protein AMR96_04415 [Candidatus Adiutrix intracellularis]|nr:MAG: hypothetical protein AMR96_04415 [Candidatus Adiutrix intracellularis]